MGYLSSDYLVLSEMKLDDSFPSAQFSPSNYDIGDRRDKDKNLGYLIEYVKKGISRERIMIFEPRKSE